MSDAGRTGLSAKITGAVLNRALQFAYRYHHPVGEAGVRPPTGIDTKAALVSSLPSVRHVL